jgi:hypothetical protein
MHSQTVLRDLDDALERDDHEQARRILAALPPKKRELAVEYACCKVNGDDGRAAWWRAQLEAAWALDEALAPGTPKHKATKAVRRFERLTGRPLVSRVPHASATTRSVGGRVIRPREHRDSGRRRKAAATRASGSRSSQDPGDPDEPEPPPGGRLCACCCGNSIEHLRRDAQYLDGTHRKRVQRARDEADPDRVAERDLARLMAAGVNLAPARCKCDPRRHLVDAGICLHCGRARELSLKLAGARP